MMTPDHARLEPVLQILHVSDLHLLAKDFEPAWEARAARCLFANIGKLTIKLLNLSGGLPQKLDNKIRHLAHLAEKGLHGHDEDAIDLLFEWLRHNVRPDPRWSETATWVVDTGDQSSNGDDASLRLGLQTLGRLSVALGNAPSLRIHGNHDAWAGKPPFISSPKELERQRLWLREKHFIADYPSSPTLSHTAPQHGLSIDIFALNTVVHDYLNNAAARGNICEDQYWRRAKKARPRSGAQIKKLAKLIESQHAENENTTLRIVLTHHPLIHGGDGGWFNALKDADVHAKALGSPQRNLDGAPLAHVVLSGHTHCLYPAPGDFSGTLDSLSAVPDQLVIGTAAQRALKTGAHFDSPESDEGTFDERHPHQAELLRVWRPFSHENIPLKEWVVLDRYVLVRENGIGPWKILVNPKNGQPGERKWIRVSP